jgi:hypothetical protein
MRHRLLTALAILPVLLAPAARAATPPHLDGIPAHIRAGSEVRITWTGLGPKVHEAELELSLAGGHWVRISPELEAREEGFTWRVPAGLSGPARLRLRYGGEWFEAEGETSTPFVIESGHRTAASAAPDRELGEWWCLDRFAGALPSAHQMSGAVTLHRAGPSVALPPEPERFARVVAELVSRSPARERARRAREHVSPCVSPPRRHPLRI